MKFERSGDNRESARICCPENFLRTSFGISRLFLGVSRLVKAAFRLSSALWRGVLGTSSLAEGVTTACSGCNCSTFLISAFFLCASCSAHCLFNFAKSASAFSSSSFNSSTRLSWPANATKNPLESLGEVSGNSTGVGGSEGTVDEVGVGLEEVGVGLEESLVFVLEAIGKLKERRLEFRGVYDDARECLTAGRGGGAIANEALLGELPTWALGAAAGSDGSPDFKIDSIDARSRDDFRR